jgi:PKD repeat protein
MRTKLNAEKIIIILLFVVFYFGCAGDSGFVDFQLNLNPPEIQGKQVTINGGVTAPVERIQWEWGDGKKEDHHFFPASHTYANPGKYEIKVTVFDSKNHSATNSVTVDIK